MGAVIRLVFCLLVSGALAGCADKANDSSAVASCIERGVAYFKDIGSYPTLTSAPNAGRSADDVARERCARSATAF